MYVHSVKLVNFKSIGTIDNEIILEPRITTIIGKNESGKSNIIEGLSYISLSGNMKSIFTDDKINRNKMDSPIEYIIVLKPTLHEQDIFNITTDTQIIINKDNSSTTGGILDYYNTNIRYHINAMIESLGHNPFQLRNQDYTNYVHYISEFQRDKSLNINQITSAFAFLESRIKNMKSESNESIIESFTNSKSKWNAIISILPITFYRNADKMLKTQYNLDDVKKELQNPKAYPNSLLSDFVKLLDIAEDEFIKAVQSGSTGPQTTIRNRIYKAVDKKINEDFKNFYTVEPISLSVEFNSNNVSFSVQSSDGEALLLSERSNGLRWYLYTFIDARAHDVSQSNVIYLFDEPGVSLHVNAQNEILNLFNDLANKGNQIAYTTHSPFMLNTNDDGIHRIRAVDKDPHGNTHIYKTAYDQRLSPQNQEDTIAPIISAIGMSLYNTFGPAKDKLNIVTEGVSDYIYLITMAKILKTDKYNINIIPSFGVTNSLNICNILNGWNCPFVAIFDFDKEGVESGGEKMRRSLLYEMGKQYLYLKDINQDSVDSKEYNQFPFMIEDMVGRDILYDFIKKNGLPDDATMKGKTLLSKLFCNALENRTYIANEIMKSRFQDLFNRILNIDDNLEQVPGWVQDGKNK